MPLTVTIPPPPLQASVVGRAIANAIKRKVTPEKLELLQSGAMAQRLEAQSSPSPLLGEPMKAPRELPIESVKYAHD